MAVEVQDCTFSLPEIPVFGYRISNNEYYSVCPLVGTASPSVEKLIVGYGTHQLSLTSEDGRTISWSFRATKPGVYKFIAPGFGSRQLLVWNPELGVRRFMSDFGYLYIHGNRDDTLNMEQLEKTATTRKISVTCGTISRLMSKLLNDYKLKSRLVFSVTLQDLNGLDDGHIVLEIRTRLGWILFDPASRTYFGNPKKFLGVADVQGDFSPKVGINITLLGPMMLIDNGGFLAPSGEDLSLLEERSRISKKSLSNWYSRVLGRVGVLERGNYLFLNEKDERIKARIISLYPASKFVDLKILKK